MARTRAKLTEKQERIIVQCQLMGLTTADMVQISNRLRALEKEKEFKAEVDDVMQGISFEVKTAKKHYIITDAKGKTYEFKLSKKQRSYFESDTWDAVVSHPGTRMKPRSFSGMSIYASHDELPSICPNKDKYIFRLARAIKANRFDK